MIGAISILFYTMEIEGKRKLQKPLHSYTQQVAEE